MDLLKSTFYLRYAKGCSNLKVEDSFVSISIRLYLNQQLFCVDPKIAAFSSTTYASQLRTDTRKQFHIELLLCLLHYLERVLSPTLAQISRSVKATHK